jgi:hypothetical protein
MQDKQRARLSAAEILEIWEKNHGPLKGQLRDRFTEHPAVQAFVRMDGELVADAISREPKLKSAMALVRSVIKHRTQEEATRTQEEANEKARKAAVRQKMRDDVRVPLDTVPMGRLARAWVNHSLSGPQEYRAKKSNTKPRRAANTKQKPPEFDGDPGF